MNWSNSWVNIESMIHRAVPTEMETARTSKVRRVVSSRLGQVTFFSSLITSPTNLSRPPLAFCSPEAGRCNMFPPPVGLERAMLSHFPMKPAASTPGAELVELHTLRVVAPVLSSCVGALSAIGTTQRNDYPSLCFSFGHNSYSMMLVTTPDPTVLPPSRIAKRSPFSRTMGEMSFSFISILSPGITISTPSGNSISPVTSVVRRKN
jgi:hypothetical protein